jgi:putative tricarboxylic transport membrane protein
VGEEKMSRFFSKTWFRFDPMVALLSIPIAIFLIFVELDTPKANIPQAVGPEAMPIGILILLIFNAFALFIRSVYGKGKPVFSVSDEGKDHSTLSGRNKYQAVILVLAGLLVYGCIVVPVGFILATAFLIIFEARVLQAGRWIRNVIIGLGFSTGVYLIFAKLLNVMLPPGIFG